MCRLLLLVWLKLLLHTWQLKSASFDDVFFLQLILFGWFRRWFNRLFNLLFTFCRPNMNLQLPFLLAFNVFDLSPPLWIVSSICGRIDCPVFRHCAAFRTCVLTDPQNAEKLSQIHSKMQPSSSGEKNYFLQFCCHLTYFGRLKFLFKLLHA